MIKIDLRYGEHLRIGDAVVRLERKTGQLACLVVDAPKEVPVRRTSAKSRNEVSPLLARNGCE